ncbi:Cof-type HAD-IIB family hydrolase [Zophobihabitans entericus]|uniref:HAD family phosphatase n=1 Tax=Zophobihabitans entericus TaxID=1635327 RepID=A0A6G9IA94_9GAMM|nr:Cof-type HAD-IIB family hydrolase [Zophobihabitans entericus]QIQ21155.1 HAD family phosphatase [Zophobihabitans entericus]
MYKLVACDMDETLLNEDKQISEQNKLAIQKARELGVQFVLASGRGFPTMQNALKTLNLHNLKHEYVISFNGGVITENFENTILEVNGISFLQAKEIVALGTNYDVGMHIYTLNDVYVYRMDAAEKEYVTGRLDGYIELTEANIDFLSDVQIIKVLFYNLNMDYLKQLEASLSEDIASQYTISYSANRYIEFNQKGVSKGTALKKLAEKLNIPVEQIIAIGDNSNDIAMIKFAGLGVSVQNGTAEVKQAANYICQANHNQSAVAEMLTKFVLNK